VKNRRKSVE